MTVVMTGRALDRDQLVRVARERETVALDPAAREGMTRTRAIVEAALAEGQPIYGASTAVGVLKRIGLEGETAAADYSRRMLRHHLVGQGPPADDALVRATMLRLANAFAGGTTGVRPLLAERLLDALNTGETPPVRSLGSIGQADLAQMADLAVALFADVDLEAGEGLALLGSNAFSTAAAALAVTDLAMLVETMTVAAALSLEAVAARLTMISPAIGDVRPYPGLVTTLARLGRLLDGSALHEPGSARQLQDPLTFRNVPQVLGAVGDALEHVERTLAIELNASQGNPIVVADERAVISVANFEILPLAAALDYVRIVLATAIGAAAERTVKLLETPWSGLRTGLVAEGGSGADAGLAYWGIAVQSLAAEARLLATPVSTEIVSTAHAEGIEDRMTMAPLAARRLAEQVALGERVVALELGVAAQAAELRGHRLGRGTAAAVAAVRETLPFLAPDDTVADAETLVDAVRHGRLAGIGRIQAAGS